MVKPEPCTNESSKTALEILTYLTDYPDAGDTLEGIVRWWMLDRAIKTESDNVRAALVELVARGFVLEQRREDSRAHYRINHGKMSEIRDALKKTSTAE
ncbi:MAG: hypothetical protein GY856_17115 [bacterium]|nr:hypothetical protein [bacterium]